MLLRQSIAATRGTYRAILLLNIGLSRRVHAHGDYGSRDGEGCWCSGGVSRKEVRSQTTGLGDRAELAPVMSYSAFETKLEAPAVFGLDEYALQVETRSQ